MSGERQYDTPPSSCPSCGKIMNAATAIDGERAPGPGDVSMCLGCGQVSRYAKDMTLRAATPAELKAMCAKQPEMRAAIARGQRLVRDFKAYQRRKVH